MARRQTLVQLTDELLESLDAHAARRSVSRSQVIRDAIASYLAEGERRAVDEAIVDGYRRLPPGELDAWAEESALRSVAAEPW